MERKNSGFIIHETERFVQRQMEKGKDFVIRLGSVRDVEEFVKLATAQPFPVYLNDGSHRINGKSFMEMFCLTLTLPLNVTADCTKEELEAFRNSVAEYLF